MIIKRSGDRNRRSVSAPLPLLERVPHDQSTSYALREFRFASFPFNWHRHPEIELTLILRGRGTRHIGDSIESFSECDLCLIGSNTPHTWHSTAGSGHEQSIVIQFLPETLDAWISAPEMRTVARLLQRARRGIVYEGLSGQKLGRAIVDLLKVPASSPQRVIGLLSILVSLVEARGRVLSSPAYVAPAGSEIDARLGAVLKELHAAEQLVPTQADMARLTNLSPAAFSRFFKRQMGRPYVRYVNEWRVGRACRMLLETEHDVTRIAFDAGFANLSNFNRRFQQIRRMTPSAYRSMSRGLPA